MFELPYHFQRRPHEGAVRSFLSRDIGRTIEAIHQALAEINSLVNWLSEQGCPRVSLIGHSLGAWSGGLVACHNSNISCAALITPISRMDRIITDVVLSKTIHQAPEK
jgi:dienelactone hydrolase